ncbi:MAG: hypothetical protein A2Z59_02145 [Nitrospinae bacterium RIFCSPLOWO2_02_39_17]|nr:MAG: hypothetical protein A2Z59_02145 [Nitrospinae bacterium RIFCSPLOWO2_02_39_17]OGW11523.1 MAG: hypothetical protein A2W75_05240 [Nitrospinae bacterium RIFCSPLOWO2_12_39_15]
MINQPYIIETFNLTKYFNRTKVKALDNINIKVKHGQIIALIGQNGAGKTTLLKILATLILPTNGTAYINGYDVTKDENAIKSCIGLVTGDERSFYWRLTARQNMEFFATLYNIEKNHAREKMEYLFNLFEIDNPDKRFQEYSAGIKQRFGIIRAMMHNPDVLLMDEPTKSLDISSAKNLRRFIKEELVLKSGKTVIFTTHRLEEIKDFCDSVALITKGKITACGKLSEEEIYKCLSEK